MTLIREVYELLILLGKLWLIWLALSFIGMMLFGLLVGAYG